MNVAIEQKPAKPSARLVKLAKGNQELLNELDSLYEDRKWIELSPDALKHLAEPVQWDPRYEEMKFLGAPPPYEADQPKKMLLSLGNSFDFISSVAL